MSAVIRVENLGKRYRLGATHAGSVREALGRGLDRLLGRTHRATAPPAQPDGRPLDPDGGFWALKDVSFEVRPGEVVGIIGHNGSGKSTLLKLLSRITAPTRGRAEIDGRVASLLEVGTGFHPELSGRENAYLNGAILGMTRSEVRRKFDDIVQFAEVEQFIDTPVKRYSSGMYVRLAFAIAAHLEPEILVVDEVLAVGDASFQKKCLGKMGEVAHAGKTVLFVSHNMQAVGTLCSRGLLMREGRMTHQGPAREIVRRHLEARMSRQAETAWAPGEAPGTDAARLGSVRVTNGAGQTSFDHDITANIDVVMEIAVLQSGAAIDASVHLMNADGLCLFATGAPLPRSGPRRTTEPGVYRTTCRIPANLLNEGRHAVSAFVVRNVTEVLAHVPEAVSFMAHDYGTARGEFVGRIIGAVRPALDWHTERIGECP